MADFLALQMEPSTFCTLQCPTCPRTTFAGVWRNTHFPMEKLARVLPLAARSELVLLQGWGEPLCHPQIHEIIRRIQETGTRCTLTTNGCLLDETRGRAILEAGLSHLTVSVSGARPETHGQLRPPSDLYALMERIRRFRALSLTLQKPIRLTLSFLQQNTNLHELPEVISLARRYDLDDCLAINASYLPTPDHEKQCPTPGIRARWASLRALWTSITRSMAYTPASVQPEEKPVCANAPLRCFTIGADGSLSPCIFLQLPLKNPSPPHPPTAVMGNLFEEDFDTLWQGRPWRDFRTAFQIRQDFYEEVYAGIDNCSEGRRRLMEAPGMLATFFSEHPPPSPCQACAKMRGL